MVRKAQLPVIGGVRKSFNIPGSNIAVGTTIAEFGSNTVTLAQLAAALGTLVEPDTGLIGGAAATASIALGPGLSGGGPVLGSVPIRLSAPIPFMFGDDGGGGDGDPGPPGLPGATGAPGVSNIPGPAVFMLANDGEDGRDAIPGNPGAPGAAGAMGIQGPIGPAVFFLAEDGADGDTIPGPQGPPGTGGSVTPGVPAAIPDLLYWFQGDVPLASAGRILPAMQNSTPWLEGLTAVSIINGTGGITRSATLLNSKGVYTFPGSGVGYEFSGVGPLLDEATIFVVFNPAIVNAYQNFTCGALNNSIQFVVNPSAQLELDASGAALIGASTTTLSAGSWFQGNATYDSVTGIWAFRVAQTAAGNGTSTHTINTGNTAIGFNPASGGIQFLNGSLAEMIIYNRVLSPTEIGTVETYLNGKWGV